MQTIKIYFTKKLSISNSEKHSILKTAIDEVRNSNPKDFFNEENASFNEQHIKEVMSKISTLLIEDITWKIESISEIKISTKTANSTKVLKSWSIKASLKSITYDCLNILADKVFIFIEPETKEILFSDKHLEAKMFYVPD